MIKKMIKNKLSGLKGQVAIEMATAIIAVFIFLLGTLQIFVWFNATLIERQEYYQSTRKQAAEDRLSSGEYDWTPPQLDIFATGE